MAEETEKIVAKTTVTIVEQREQSALVEWDAGKAGLKRVYIPNSEMDGDQVAAGVLAKGIPHGVPWEELIEVSSVTPLVLAVALRKCGVWTADDVQVKPKAVLRALKDVFPLTPAKLRRAAVKYETEED